MKRAALVFYLMFASAIALVNCGSSAVFADSITYVVDPVALSRGYSIEGGFITTNGTLGTLLAADILDYQFDISGPSPIYTFTPLNPGAHLEINGFVTATVDELVVPIDSEATNSGYNSLQVFARDNTDPRCLSCSQTVQFLNNLDLSDAPPSITTVAYSYLDVDLGILASGGAQFQPQQVFTIATVSDPVPESSSIVMALLGMCLASPVVLRRSRKPRPRVRPKLVEEQQR